MGPTLGGGTQDTDFNKGFTKGNFTKIFGEEMGLSGGPRPAYAVLTAYQDEKDESS